MHSSFPEAAATHLLINDAGAHNLFFITDGVTHDKLRGPMGVNFDGLKFAVGGRDSLHPLPGYDGIFLYAFCMTDGGCHVQRCKFLVDGNHEGLIERRHFAPGYGVFDGQNTLVFYDGAFHLFVRGNASAEGGYRCVLYASSTNLKHFSAFRKIEFPGIPDNANVYFAHPYPVGDSLMLVMPVAFPAGHHGESGIHAAVSHSRGDAALFFEPSLCLISTSVFQGRTSDVNAAGGRVSPDGRALDLMLHRNIHGRVNPGDRRDPESLECWNFDISCLRLPFAGGGPESSASHAAVPIAMQTSVGTGASEPSSSLASLCDSLPTPKRPRIDIEASHDYAQTTLSHDEDHSMCYYGHDDVQFTSSHDEYYSMSDGLSRQWEYYAMDADRSDVRWASRQWEHYEMDADRADIRWASRQWEYYAMDADRADSRWASRLIVDERTGHGVCDWRYAPWMLEARTHKKLAWNKAAVLARMAKMCGKCSAFPDSVFRACQQCLSTCCTSCLPQDRLCCSQCPCTSGRLPLLVVHHLL